MANDISPKTSDPPVASLDAIEADDVWLKFNIQFVRQELSVRGFILQWTRQLFNRNGDAESSGQRKEFWALRGIDMRIGHGEIVGLLGSNGAGKSTLLMALAGIYHPDRGRVVVRGTVGTLLTLGAGFNPALTGVENIRQAGIFMGLPHNYINEHLDEIIEMVDIGEFIHAPLRTYSSGMKARLGFAMAVHINPDVILLDEVMETGDQAFRRKSTNLLKTFREQGKTVVIASHNMKALTEFCTRVVWLDHGAVVADGSPAEITEQYQQGGVPTGSKS